MSDSMCECCDELSSQPSKADHCHSTQNSQEQDYFEHMWYNWWWNYQNNIYQSKRNDVANNDATWCRTCVEEQRLREARVKSLRNKPTYISHGSQSSLTVCEMNGRVVGKHGNERSPDIADMPDYEDSEHDEEFEMELNDDFKLFLEQSARHKEERSKYQELKGT